MALNNSGKISLAGSTAGESIATELGLGATTQISLNDTVVRALAGVTTGIIQLDDFYGKSSASYWIRSFSQAGSGTGAGLTCASPFGSDYLIFMHMSFTSQNIVSVLKIKFDGTIVFNKRVASSWGDLYTTMLVTPAYIFPDDSFLISTNQRITGPNWPYPIAQKFNSDMTTCLFSSWAGAFSNTHSGSLSCDVSNNVYHMGVSDDRGVLKFNATTGALLVATSTKANGTGTESAANSYTGAYDSSQSHYISFNSNVVKMNSSMTMVWSYQYDAGTQHGTIVKINDNKFILTYGKVSFGSNLCAFDANGDVIWSKRIFDFSSALRAQSISKDSSNNIYVVLSPSNENFVKYIYKFDSDGNQIWQRSLSSGQTTSGVSAGNLEIGTDGNMYVCYGLSNGRGFLFKLPADGSMMGVYTIDGVTFTYANSTKTITTTTISKAAFGTPYYGNIPTGSQAPVITTSSVTSNSVTI